MTASSAGYTSRMERFMPRTDELFTAVTVLTSEGTKLRATARGVRETCACDLDGAGAVAVKNGFYATHFLNILQLNTRIGF